MILKFRALSGDNEGFARDYEISEKSTLLDLHSLIQHDLGYDPSQMASFFTVDQDWGKLREFTLFDMGETNDDKMLAPISMEEVSLESIVHERNQRLLYNFDLFNDRGLFLEMLERKNPEVGVGYPAVTFSIGDAPFQIEMPGDENAYEDMMSDFNDFESYEDYDQRYEDEY